MSNRRPVLPLLALALSCVDAVIDLPVGPHTATAQLPVREVPAQLLDANGALRRLQCDAATPCPQTGSARATLRCEGGACAVAPFAMDVTTGDIDLTAYSTYRDYANALDDVRVEAVSIRLTGARVGNSLGPMQVWWTGASNATGVSERALGTSARVTLTQSAVTVPVTLDAAGTRELVQRVLRGEVRFRVRMAGTIEAGAGALPDPEVSLAVTLLLHLRGSL
jgi:hypothetical protein